MSIELDDITSGYNLSKINNNFQKVEEYLNDKVLVRAKTSVPGEAKMERDLDMDGNRILNADIDASSLTNDRAIRVADINSIPAIPQNDLERRGKVVTFDVNTGNPIAVTPASGSAVDVLNQLALPTGAGLIGVQPKGTLSNLLTFVTPEQFGAIGDGTIHPLSERFATLALAQAAYPLITITSLTQTIDWAAFQSAANYSRGVTRLVAREFSSYHLGRDGLLIDQYSHWQGGMCISQGLRNCELKKTPPTATPVFQQDYIVRVKPGLNDNPAGSFDYKDQISIRGFRLTYDVPRRTSVKGANTIAFHGGNMVKGNFDIAVWGAEYGLYAWVFWGNTGHLRVDSCHKGYFVVPHLGDNERAGSGTTTSNRIRIECDVTPFPITIGRDSYSQYNGYFEGSVSTDGNYDSANETACGITIIDSCTGVTFDMGIEKWQGVHVTKAGTGAAEASFRFGWFTDDHYKMSTGNDGSDASLRAILGSSGSKIQLPAAQRAYLNNLAGNSSFTFHDTSWYMGGVFSETTSTRYLVNIQSTASVFSFIGGSTGFTPEVGAAPVAFSINEQMKSRVEVVGCRNMELWCSPSTQFKLIGRNSWRRTSRLSQAMSSITGGQIYTLSAPVGYSVDDVLTPYLNLGDGSTGAANVIHIGTLTEGSISTAGTCTLLTSFTASAATAQFGYTIRQP